MWSQLELSSHGCTLLMLFFTSFFFFKIILHFFSRPIWVDRMAFFFIREWGFLVISGTKGSSIFIEIIFKGRHSSLLASWLSTIEIIFHFLNTWDLWHLQLVKSIIGFPNFFVHFSKPRWVTMLGHSCCRLSFLHKMARWWPSHALASSRL